MSELPGASRVPGLSPMHGLGDVLQGGVGGGGWIPEARAGPLAGAARATAGAPGRFPRRPPPGPPVPPPPLRLLELHEQRMFQHYLHTSPLIPARLLRDIEERRRLFVEGCKAREAAFDADPPQMDSDARAFTLALAAPGAPGATAD